MDTWNIDRVADWLEERDIAIDREAMNLARWIWDDIMGFGRLKEKRLGKSELQRIELIMDKLFLGEPVQYIAGHAWFYGLKLKVSPDVLIPRPETEELVEWVISEIKNHPQKPVSVLDIGTGSGCIAVVLKKKIGDGIHVVAIDISPGALSLARINCDDHNVAVDLFEHDFLKKGFEGLGRFDVIVSNPPYVNRASMDKDWLKRLKYEPGTALYPPGDDPDIFYRKIAAEGMRALKPGGLCFLEMNEFRTEEIEHCFAKHHWPGIEKRIDMQGFPRMLRVGPVRDANGKTVPGTA